MEAFESRFLHLMKDIYIYIYFPCFKLLGFEHIFSKVDRTGLFLLK